MSSNAVCKRLNVKGFLVGMSLVTVKNKIPMKSDYSNFNAFYPDYLKEHQDPICRLLHVCGSTCVLLMLAYALFTGHYALLFTLPLIGYGFAWVGHFFFEKNRPATFTYPWYSLLGDWVLFKDVLIGKEKIRP